MNAPVQASNGQILQPNRTHPTPIFESGTRTSCFHCTEHALQCPAYSGKGLAAHLSTAMVRTFQCSDRCRIERIEYARSTREASGKCGATDRKSTRLNS